MRSRVADLPKRIKYARGLRGYTQAQLADNAGMPSSQIGHYESGSREPSCTQLVRLADALEVSTDYLLGRVPYIPVNGLWRPIQ